MFVQASIQHQVRAPSFAIRLHVVGIGSMFPEALGTITLYQVEYLQINSHIHTVYVNKYWCTLLHRSIDTAQCDATGSLSKSRNVGIGSYFAISLSLRATSGSHARVGIPALNELAPLTVILALAGSGVRREPYTHCIKEPSSW